jgi:predicted amino acid-binding ACT domain protein
MMARRVVMFDGKKTAAEVKKFFTTTDAEVLEMSNEILDGNFYFIALVDVDPRAFDAYLEKKNIF